MTVSVHPESTTSSTSRTGPSGTAPSIANTPSRFLHWRNLFSCAFCGSFSRTFSHDRIERQSQCFRDPPGVIKVRDPHDSRKERR